MERRINIKDLIGVSSAINRSDGELVYDTVERLFVENDSVILDFSEIDLVITVFLNAAIGQLYGRFSEDFVKNHIKVVGMDNSDLVLLKLVVETAKEYFKDKQQIQDSTENYIS